MEYQFASLELDHFFSRWPALEAVDLKPDLVKDYCPGRLRPRTMACSRWQLSGVEIAIFESHRRIWEQVVERALPYAVILEDDVKLSSCMVNAIAHIETLNSVVDVVKLDRIRKIRRFGPPIAGIELEVRPIVEQQIYSAAAYVVSLEGARKLLAWSSPYSDLVDAFIFCPRESYRLFQLFPAVATQGGLLRHPERSDGPNVPTAPVPDIGISRKPASRGPLWFRLSREFRLGLGRAKRLLGGDRRLVEQGGWIGMVPLAADLTKFN